MGRGDDDDQRVPRRGGDWPWLGREAGKQWQPAQVLNVSSVPEPAKATGLEEGRRWEATELRPLSGVRVVKIMNVHAAQPWKKRALGSTFAS